MALANRLKQIIDGAGNPFSMVMAKLSTTPADAADSDIVVSGHCILDASSEAPVPFPTALGPGGGWKTDIADGSHITFGAKEDAKSSATDTTAVSSMSVWKQISFSVQALATSISTADVTLLTAASATGSAVAILKGRYNWAVYGTFSGGTTQLQWSPDSGTTWLNIDGVTLTANGLWTDIPLSAGHARVLISGAGSASLTSKLGAVT